MGCVPKGWDAIPADLDGAQLIYVPHPAGRFLYPLSAGGPSGRAILRRPEEDISPLTELSRPRLHSSLGPGYVGGFSSSSSSSQSAATISSVGDVVAVEPAAVPQFDLDCEDDQLEGPVLLQLAARLAPDQADAPSAVCEAGAVSGNPLPASASLYVGGRPIATPCRRRRHHSCAPAPTVRDSPPLPVDDQPCSLDLQYAAVLRRPDWLVLRRDLSQVPGMPRPLSNFARLPLGAPQDCIGVHIFTDGSYLPSPVTDKGGWAFAVFCLERGREPTHLGLLPLQCFV